MPALVPIVEGDGDIKAVPILLRRILHEWFEYIRWNVARPMKAYSLPALRKLWNSWSNTRDRKDLCHPREQGHV